MAKISNTDRAVVNRYLRQKPVPLGAMAKELGVKVLLSVLDPGHSGMIECKCGKFVIRINRYESRERQRFSLAHEIAHFLLHQDIVRNNGAIVDNVLYRSGEPERVEYEANRLAAELILPEDCFRSDLPLSGSPATVDVLERLADEWEVSKAALEVRLSQFGIAL